MTIINIVAIVVSPAIAVLISMWLQNRREKRQQKFYILSTLLSTRHTPITDENVRALNMIDMVFYNNTKIRELWHEYYDMLANEGLSNPLGHEQRQKKNQDLIFEIAKSLGYGKAITHLDVSRVYYPVGLGEQLQRSEELANELLRVLKESRGLQVIPKNQEYQKRQGKGNTKGPSGNLA